MENEIQQLKAQVRNLFSVGKVTEVKERGLLAVQINEQTEIHDVPLVSFNGVSPKAKQGDTVLVMSLGGDRAASLAMSVVAQEDTRLEKAFAEVRSTLDQIKSVLSSYVPSPGGGSFTTPPATIETDALKSKMEALFKE